MAEKTFKEEMDEMKADLVKQLVAMGYPEPCTVVIHGDQLFFLRLGGLFNALFLTCSIADAMLASDEVDPALSNALELCFHWMEENPIGEPLTTRFG